MSMGSESDDEETEAVNAAPNPHDPTDIEGFFADLPLFPLSGVILLPGCLLPLHIYEDRYIAMMENALMNNRMLGIIQPEQPGEPGTSPAYESRRARQPALQKVGTMARIIKWEEADDGGFDVVLKGVCRFDLESDKLMRYGFRLGEVDYLNYEGDIESHQLQVDREELIHVFQSYLDLHEIKVGWDNIEEVDYERFVNTIASIVPFTPLEKQALLETPTIEDRYQQMLMIMRMAILDQQMGSDPQTVN